MFFLVFFSLLFFFLSFYKSSNKIIATLYLVLMWIMFAFSSETADYNIYQRRFYNNGFESTEPLFNFIVKALNSMGLGLNFFIFLIGTSFFLSLVLLLFNYKLNIQHYGFILCLYFIYPFPMDIVQLRNTMSFIPILIGFKYLISDKKNNELKYFFCVFLSMMIHFSGIFYLLFWVSKKLSVKQATIFTILFIFSISALNNFSDIAVNIASKFGAGGKVNTVLNNVILQTSETIFGTKVMMIITFITIFSILSYIYKKSKDNFTLLLIKINILLMITYPLLDYAVDLFRIQRYSLIFVYICFAKYIMKNSDNMHNRNSLGMLGFKITCLVVPILGFYFNIYRSDIMSIVWQPILENNILFK